MESKSDSWRDGDSRSAPCFAEMKTLAPNELKSEWIRCFASVWRFRRAAETAAPEESARRITKRRPRLAKRRRRTRRRNIGLLLRGRLEREEGMFIRLGGWERVRSAWRGEEEAR